MDGVNIKQKYFLDIGCGENKQQGFIGMDKRKLKGVDIVHDCEIIPWPIKKGSCSILKMSHVMEHIKPWLSFLVMDECWRVLENDGIIMLSMPYGGSFRYFQDPTHCNPWNEVTPEYFDPQFPLYQIYKPLPWRIEKRYWDIHGDIEIAFRKIDGRT